VKARRAIALLGAGAVLPPLAALVAAVGLQLAVPASHAADGEVSQFEIESALTCQCGCGLTVHSCNHLNCGSGIPLKKEIAEQIAGGASANQVIAYFEKKYGEKILSAPTTRGFNLAAWTVPFVAIGLGGGLIGFVLLRWRRDTPDQATGAGPSASPTSSSASPELRARLQRELERFDERS
jgi:cytochrome c-type biogenesis protein CcmH